MVLDPIFIFLFQMDIAGAAIATMLSNVAATVYFFGFLHQIRQGSVITLSPKCFALKRDVSLEVLAVGLPSFIMTLMSTLSNLTLNKTISGYSNEAVAGMGIAKKIDLTAFAIAQGMTQGTLPLIGYNYSSGNRRRMLSAVKVLLVDCLVLAFNVAVGIRGVAWATPLADGLALIVSAALLLPYLKKLMQNQPVQG